MCSERIGRGVQYLFFFRGGSIFFSYLYDKDKIKKVKKSWPIFLKSKSMQEVGSRSSVYTLYHFR